MIEGRMLRAYGSVPVNSFVCLLCFGENVNPTVIAWMRVKAANTI